MTRDKALIIGASGLIGQSAARRFQERYNVIGTYFRNPKAGLVQLDYTDPNTVGKLISDLKPVILFDAVNLTGGVDFCERNKVKAKIWHYDSVVNLVDICKEKDIYLILISTDYIFDGERGPYREDDEPNPLNTYGLLKLMAEEYIQRHLSRYLIARTTNVYGWDPESKTKNFVMGLIDRFRSGEQIRVPIDQYGNPTLAENLVDCIFELVQKDETGLYNIAGADRVNRHEWAKTVADVFGFDRKLLIPLATEELNPVAKRPLTSGFITEKVESKVKTKMIGLDSGLKSFLLKCNLSFF